MKLSYKNDKVTKPRNQNNTTLDKSDTSQIIPPKIQVLQQPQGIPKAKKNLIINVESEFGTPFDENALKEKSKIEQNKS